MLFNKATKSIGKFISFEGIDGAGKSSHIAWFADELVAHGRSLIVSREPGGTAVGEKLREIILNDKMEAATEALLVFAARQEHVQKVITPGLQNGDWVLCDRFTDATFAYQGYGRGFPLEKLEILESWVQADLRPDLTIIFDCEPEVAALRLAASRDADKFESESLEFFIRVRNGYLAHAAREPERYAIVNSTESIDRVRAQLMPLIAALLAR